MSLFTMCDKEAVGAYFQPYHGANQFHEGVEGVWMRETHKGIVLYTYERNGYDDSDFYAVVWNEEKNEPESVEYASTRGWCYPNYAKEDTTPEILAKYEAHKKKIRDAENKLREEYEKLQPRVGRLVEVIRGRKVPIGTKGNCFFRGLTRYGQNMVGIETAAGKVFVKPDYVRAVQ
jgi:hypothetical protein